MDSIPNGDDKSMSPTRVGEMEGESRKRKYPSDRAYFIAKEILTTERTYKKDLQVINLVSTVTVHNKVITKVILKFTGFRWKHTSIEASDFNLIY